MTPFPVRTRVVRTNALLGLGGIQIKVPGQASPADRIAVGNFRSSHPPLAAFTTDAVGDAIRRQDAAANDMYQEIQRLTEEHNAKLAAGPSVNKQTRAVEPARDWINTINALASQRTSLIGRFNNALNVAKGALTQSETYLGFTIRPESRGGVITYDVIRADNSVLRKAATDRQAARAAVDKYLAEQSETQREADRKAGEAAAQADAAAAVSETKTAGGAAPAAGGLAKPLLIGGAALAAFALFK